MAYPYDSPSILMSTIWNSGGYTPENTVIAIRDGQTPVNKNSLRNSVGYQISAVQNFINSKTLGRNYIPIESGYISNLSGDIVSTRILECPYAGTNNYYTSISNSQIYQYKTLGDVLASKSSTTDVFSMSNINSSTNINYDYNINNSGYQHNYKGTGSKETYAFSASPISGLYIKYHVGSTGSEEKYVHTFITPTGIRYSYRNETTPTSNRTINITVTPSSELLTLGSKNLTIGNDPDGDINFITGDYETTPVTTYAAPTISSYIGKDGDPTTVLMEPPAWWTIALNGTFYNIPLYTYV